MPENATLAHEFANVERVAATEALAAAAAGLGDHCYSVGAGGRAARRDTLRRSQEETDAATFG